MRKKSIEMKNLLYIVRNQITRKDAEMMATYVYILKK